MSFSFTVILKINTIFHLIPMVCVGDIRKAVGVVLKNKLESKIAL